MGAGASGPNKAETKRGTRYRVLEQKGDWFYAEDDARIGPCTAARLHALHADGTVPNRALVWCPRLTQWMPYRDALHVLMREVAPASAAEAAAPEEAGQPHGFNCACPVCIAQSLASPRQLPGRQPTAEPAVAAGATRPAAAASTVATAGSAHPAGPATAPTGRRLLSGPSVGVIQGLPAPSASATPSHVAAQLVTPPAASRSPTKRGFGWSSRKSFSGTPTSPASPAAARSSSTPVSRSVQADTDAAPQSTSASSDRVQPKAEPLVGSPLKRGGGLEARRTDPLKPPPGGGVAARFVALSELKAHGRLPRLGSKPTYKHRRTGEGNANLCRHRVDFPPRTAFVFVSHLWARPSGAADSAHPDDENKSKHTLIVAALEALRGGVRGSAHAPLPLGVEVAVWIDWCCLDQDAPSSKSRDEWTKNERRQIGKLVGSCDIVLTPILDPEPQGWEYPAVWTSHLSQYRAEPWQEYWARAWCGLEALCAAVYPVADAKGRASLLGGALSSALVLGRRRHVIFGTKVRRGSGSNGELLALTSLHLPTLPTHLHLPTLPTYLHLLPFLPTSPPYPPTFTSLPFPPTISAPYP
jgi:hypothetical protein